MSNKSTLILDISEAIQALDHGDTLTKFVAIGKGEAYINGCNELLNVEIHGFVTSSGEFITATQAFERIEQKKESS